jgi:PAS domain S-box-containing protein
MGELIRAHDWSETPLGPIDGWSLSLRTMVSFMLANRFPLLLWWGPEYISIYNDPYRPVLGAKHPWALGKPVRECWSEIWDVLRPLIDAPFHGGPATWSDDLSLELNRHGFLEETHFTVAYSPVPDESAPTGIGGVLATVHEITEKVVGERRITALRDLGTRSAESKSVEESCGVAVAALANYRKDVPFAAVYLFEDSFRRARLTCATDMDEAESVASPVIDIGITAAFDRPWPILDLLRSQKMCVVQNLADRFSKLSSCPWSDRPHTAAVVPIKSNKAHQLAGFLIAAVSPRLRLDDQYRSFLDLVAAQIATAISTARAYEEERRRAEALAEIDQAKTLFFSNVSHEFRTPLTLMLGPLEDAMASPQLPPSERVRLDVAHRNSLRLLKLVNSLLDFSRIEAGRARALYEPIDLAAFTADLAEVEAVADGQAALTAIRQRRPDLVITDVMMPRLDGFGLVRAIRSDPALSDVPVIMLSARAGEESRVDGLESGADDYLVKPFSAREVIARVSANLRLAQVRRQATDAMRRNEAWLLGQKEAFQAAMNGASLALSLGILSRIAVEQAESERRCAFYVADDHGGLRHVVGMPESYARRVEGFRVGPESLACGLALGTGEPVITPDVLEEPRWQPWLSLASDYDFRGCWSFPVETASGKLVSSFEMYFREPRTPTARDRELAAAITHTAGIIVSRYQEAEERARISQQFETLLNRAPLGVYLVDADFRIREVNPIARPVFGDIPDLIGRDFDEVMHVLWPKPYADEVVQRFRHTLETGASYETPEWIQHRRDRKSVEYYEWRIDRIQLADGRFGVVCYFRDISTQVANRDRLKLLIEELNHRVKNTLAAVQSISVLTLRDAPSVLEGRRALESRLLALAAAHDVLTLGHWEGADIYAVIEGSLAAYRSDSDRTRLSVSGPNIHLVPRAALALSMAIHELATNAAKYGALSSSAGRIDLNWHIVTDDPPLFSFRWTEIGGPPVTKPKKRGFGSRLIERGLAQDLDGDIQLDFASTGVVCSITAALKAVSGKHESCRSRTM